MGFLQTALFPPKLDPAELELERRKAEFQLRRRICRDRLGRIGAILELGANTEALAAGCVLLSDLRSALAALRGISLDPNAADIRLTGVNGLDLTPLPNDALSEELGNVVESLKALLRSPRKDLASPIKVWIANCQEFLRGVDAEFKKLLASDYCTSRDVYKRRTGLVAAASTAALGCLVAIGTLVYYVTAPRISIVEATYGMSCNGKAIEAGGKAFQVQRGNATSGVSDICQGAVGSCRLTVTGWSFGDPAPMCAKDFDITWRCSNRSELRTGTLPAEAMGKSLRLSCR